MTNSQKYHESSKFLQYLARENNDGDRLPALTTLSQNLGLSLSSLREQLEVARALGLVDVRPKTGIHRLPYRFTPAVVNSLSYATQVDRNYFFQLFSDFRNHIEAVYWHEAIASLTLEDFDRLGNLVGCAMRKLSGSPIQIPHAEHRQLHLSIYRRLSNPFVTGVLEAYWETYEAVGLDVYTDISYLKKVWSYHQKMVEAICNQKDDEGYTAFIEHVDLLQERFHPDY